MQRQLSDSNTAREESRRFRDLLRGILKGRKPVDELLENALFKRRLTTLCRLLAKNEWEDLYNDVCIKLWKVLQSSFKPDFREPYGKFFAWLNKVAKYTFFDKIRGLKPEITDVTLEEIERVGARTEIDEDLEERKRRFWDVVAKLPDKQRLAVTLYVEYGYSTREVADILTKTGMKCTHASVAKWVRDALRTAFPEAPMIKEAMSQALPLPEPLRKPNAPAGRRANTRRRELQKDERKVSSDRVLPLAELPRKPNASAGRRVKARTDGTQRKVKEKASVKSK